MLLPRVRLKDVDLNVGSMKAEVEEMTRDRRNNILLHGLPYQVHPPIRSSIQVHPPTGLTYKYILLNGILYILPHDPSYTVFRIRYILHPTTGPPYQVQFIPRHEVTLIISLPSYIVSLRPA
jgi:hypothetical protein